MEIKIKMIYGELYLVNNMYFSVFLDGEYEVLDVYQIDNFTRIVRKPRSNGVGIVYLTLITPKGRKKKFDMNNVKPQITYLY